MDRLAFDELTRRLAGSGTRRAGLRAVLGGLIALAAGETETAGATDKHQKRQKRRKRTRQRNRQDAPVGTRYPCDPGIPDSCPSRATCLVFGDRGQCICQDSGLPPCDGICCGPDQTCTLIGDKPICICRKDNRPACEGQCCLQDMVCYDAFCRRCRALLEICQEDSHCCGDTVCGDSGACCRGLGSACKAGECCSRLSCEDGTCVRCKSHTWCK